MSPDVDETNDNPFLRAGFDAWCFGVSTSMLLGLRTMRMVSEAQVGALSALLGSTNATSTALTIVPSPVPLLTDARAEELKKQRNHDLLVAVLPRDEARDAPLRMYSGSRDVVPWRYDK